MPITIPERLQQKLRCDSAYDGYIHTLLKNTAPLITEKADFFPEYTIHGWSHIQAVLFHADKLIPDDTMDALSGRDAALLIAAVVLHDLGMFLNKAGVRKLLTGSRSTTKSARLDKYDWQTEWDHYIREIRRYPEEKLLYHFGMSRAIEEPDLSGDEFSDLELLIVGDFLRRHHHRIAHEIALGTMPGDTDIDVLQVGMDALGTRAFSPKDRRCIGILARSHGMAIRETRDYIDREVGRQYKEKLTYLMAVLRLADALDADEQRAPDTRRRLEGIRTPVSVQEWTWNQRISRTDLDWDDAADFKYIEAEPESTTEFVHLERWLRGIQQELDTCWAVLSELCDTRRFRLSIHRIESNLLEEERRRSYDEKFITRDARLNANPELLKLLVAPLYDDDPGCGVRELLQNAVDACNERAHLEKDGYLGAVQIRLDTAAKTMTVTDNGIGMDENVLLNYYLSAGASYRTSDEWYQHFAADRDPSILRTGRFGVGVLATFLLGHHIRVTTRHMDDPLGYTFEFGPEPKALDIKRPEEVPEIGTTITVTLREDALAKLRADYHSHKDWLNWYRFETPSVRYWVDNEEYVGYRPFIPQDDQDLKGWFELPDTEYELVCWGHPGEGLFCNGIRIPGGYDSCGFSGRKSSQMSGLMMEYWWNYPMIPYPCLSVIDKRGRLQVDLSRRMVDDAALAQLVDRELARFAVALLLTADWSSEKAAAERLRTGIWRHRSRAVKDSRFVCSSKSYTVLRSSCFGSIPVFPLLMLHVPMHDDRLELVRMLHKAAPEYPFSLYPTEDYMTIFDSVSPFFHDHVSGENIPSAIETKASTLWLDRRYEQEFSTLYESLMHDYHTYVDGDTEQSCLVITKAPDYQVPPVAWEHWNWELCPVMSLHKGNRYRGISQTNRQDQAIVQLILRLFPADDAWIPYDMDERRKKFPEAFEELKYYIDRLLPDREKK